VILFVEDMEVHQMSGSGQEQPLQVSLNTSALPSSAEEIRSIGNGRDGPILLQKAVVNRPEP
jgi:hypothetical protein